MKTNLLQTYHKTIAVLLLLITWYMPIFMSLIIVLLGNDYMATMDIAFEYLGKEPFNRQESKNVEISSAIYGSIGNNFWAYIADNEEEYCSYYAKNGMSKDIYEQVDFDNYIMVMSVNRPVTAIRIMKNYPVWKDSVPYSYPQFVFGREMEREMIYYYKVYRIDTQYQKQGQKIISRLKLWANSYFEQKSSKYPKPMPMVEAWGPLKKWKWVFDLFNHYDS